MGTHFISSTKKLGATLRHYGQMSTRVVITMLLIVAAQISAAHEVRPAIADFHVTEMTLEMNIRLNLEAIMANIDLTSVADTDEAAPSQASEYDRLRAETPAQLGNELRDKWPEMQSKISVLVEGSPLTLELNGLTVDEDVPLDLARDSVLRLFVDLPSRTKTVQIGWASEFGPLVLRQDASVPEPYTGYLTNGDISPPIDIQNGTAQSALATFWTYGVLGFEHILPKGLDHILFVLGLFLLSLKMRPLLLQITAFTLAHTVTLALGILGIVTVSPAIVEPLIALSIVYVAVENIVIGRLSPWRPFVVFGFGLLHGLGFASVLGELGLDPSRFVVSLIGFNVGVEVGQLTVIAMAFIAVGLWFRHKPWYRSRITNPASAVIALVAAYWTIERVFF